MSLLDGAIDGRLPQPAGNLVHIASAFASQQSHYDVQAGHVGRGDRGSRESASHRYNAFGTLYRAVYDIQLIGAPFERRHCFRLAYE